jgi:hypothetical protein
LPFFLVGTPDHPLLSTLLFKEGTVKKFFVKLPVFCAIFLGLVVSIITLLPFPLNSYNFAILDKHRLLETTVSPKLVLAGGSNCAFGIDSAALAGALHIPVVNIGVQASFGLGRILDDVSPFLNPGDILAIIPEYEHFTTLWNGEDSAYILIIDCRQYRLLRRPGKYDFPRGFLGYVRTHLEGVIARYLPPDSAAYRRDRFNEYGDYVGHLEAENRDFEPMPLPDNTLDQDALKRFFRMAEEFQGRGIRILLSYPSYDAVLFDHSQRLINELDGLFRENEHIQVISHPGDYCFPRSLFYDTIYHLNAEGRRLRTETLRQDLERTGLFQSPKISARSCRSPRAAYTPEAAYTWPLSSLFPAPR